MQTRLPIFDDTTFNDALDTLKLTHYNIVPQKRLTRSWRIEKKGTLVTIFIPVLFTTTPTVITPLLLWAQLLENNNFSRRGIGPGLKKLEEQIYESLNQETSFSKHRQVKHPEKRFRFTTGTTYDLRPLFDKLNQEHFESKLVSWLRWGNSGSKTSYHNKFCDEKGLVHDLITIAGVYNQPTVPSFALESVLYHEMLHIAVPPIVKPGVRRHVHHKEFRRQEALFPHYDAWQKWLLKSSFRLS